MEAAIHTHFLAEGCAHIATNKLMLKEDLRQMSVYLYEYA